MIPGDTCVGRGIEPREPGHFLFELALRAGCGSAAGPPPQDGIASRRTVGKLGRSIEQHRGHRRRQPEVERDHRHGALESFRRHTHDGYGLVIDTQGPAQDPGRQVKPGPPVVVGDDRDGRGTGPGCLSGREEPAQRRAQSQRAEVIVRHQHAVGALDPARGADIERDHLRGQDLLKRRQVRAQILKLRPGYARVRARLGAGFDQPEARGVLHARQRRQHQPLDPREHRRVDADADCQRANDHAREQRHPENRPDGVPQIRDQPPIHDYRPWSLPKNSETPPPAKWAITARTSSTAIAIPIRVQPEGFAIN